MYRLALSFGLISVPLMFILSILPKTAEMLQMTNQFNA